MKEIRTYIKYEVKSQLLNSTETPSTHNTGKNYL